MRLPWLPALAAAVILPLIVAGCGGGSTGPTNGSAATSSSASGATQPVPFSFGDVIAGIGNGRWNHFDAQGRLLATLDDGHVGTIGGFTPIAATAGACFDGDGNMYGVNLTSNYVSVFNRSGTLTNSSLGVFDRNPESCLVVDGKTLYVSEVTSRGDIIKLALDGTEQARYDVRRSDWIDLGSDHCTMFYTDEGPVIHRHDVCQDHELPAFASPGGENFALRVLPDNSVLIAAQASVRRFSSSGAVIAAYAAPSESRLFSLNLDPDGKHFWTASLNGSKIYKFAIDPVGPPVMSFDAQVKAGGGTGLAGLALFGEPMASHPLQPAASQSSDLTLWLVILVALIVVALLLALLVVRRRRQKTDPAGRC